MVALVVAWVVLASRQMMTINDVQLHLGLAASIRAGSFPPTFSWQPGVPAPYHHGINLLVALLAPPFGPDPAFTTELMDTYMWTAFAVVLTATVLRSGSWISAVITCPLLLSFGLWTQLPYTAPPGIVDFVVPTGIPEAGLRASLADIYWPSAPTYWNAAAEASPPNIWRPNFVLTYALALVVLERASTHHRLQPAAQITLAFVAGFIGLLDEFVAVIVIGLWIALEASRLLRYSDFNSLHQKQHEGNADGALQRKNALGTILGPGLAATLLVAEGGIVTSILTGTSDSGVSLAWISNAGSRRPISELEISPGGVGVLEAGTIPVVATAIALRWRNRLVIALAIASTLLLLAALTIRYEFSNWDVARLDGHARNFALAALLIGLSTRMPDLSPRWRYVVGTMILASIAWPTAIGPVQNLLMAVSQGPQLSNAKSLAAENSPRSQPFRGTRYAMPAQISALVSDVIRERLPVDTPVLSPYPSEMSILTGRPNAAGFPRTVQYHDDQGPEYLDAIRYLEPIAIRRLGFSHIHAPDAWAARLPDRAQRWLRNPAFFELLAFDDTEALYQILPAFYGLKSTPHPESFEALRQAVPTGSTVYFSAVLEPRDATRVATVLAHTHLLGREIRPPWHTRLEIEMAPLHKEVPDLVVTPLHRAPSAFPFSARQPVWWNKNLAIYAPGNVIRPILPPPSQGFEVQIEKLDVTEDYITFSATFTNRSSEYWTGQDWLVTLADASPWAIPLRAESNLTTHAASSWFSGQMIPGLETLTHTYSFDAHRRTLAVAQDDTLRRVRSSGQRLDPGSYTLAVRLQRSHREVALIPVMKFAISSSGDVSYETYEGPLGASLRT